MAYAAYTDVQNEFKSVDFTDADAAVTSTEVTEFIAEEEAKINQTIANKYTTPVSDSTSVLILKAISIAFVAYRVASILDLVSQNPLPDSDAKQQLNYGSAYRNAQKFLEQIRTGKINLSSDDMNADQGINDYNYANDISPTFERDADQW